MEILNQIIETIKSTFSLFKERDKKKYDGDRFEEWVVKNSNISKNGSNFDSKFFWKLLEWRGDKFIDGYRALSSSAPDLLLECINQSSQIYKSGDIIAVECKWRSNEDFFIDRKQINNYENYISANGPKFPIRNLFYVFGFGWSKDGPERVYVIPANELYHYDKTTRKIQFPEEEKANKINRLQQYRHENINKSLIYKPCYRTPSIFFKAKKTTTLS